MMQRVTLLLFVVSLSLEVNSTSLGLLRKTSKEPKPSGYGMRPRGVPSIHGGLYTTDANFSCFISSKIIPFSYVNDNYCDCRDGSDEAGTSACSNAKFHCLNGGYKAVDIPSGRVNDQICDCCDGSDEWDSAVECPNMCEEMGTKWREEIQRRAAVAQKGYMKRLELAQEGAKLKAEKEKGIDALRKERDELSPKKDEAEAKKKEAEEKETEAKDRHRKAWEEERDRKKQIKIVTLFGMLDANSDQKITLDEVKAFKEFDADNNGEVSDDEAKDHLFGVEESDLEHFKTNVYETIKMLFPDPDEEDKERKSKEDANKVREGEKLEILLSEERPKPESEDVPTELDEPGEIKPEETQDDAVSELEKLEELNTGDTHKEDEQHFDRMPPPPTLPPPSQLRLEDGMPDYDDETKKLMAEADEARKALTEVSNRIAELDASIRDTESYLNGDFGVDSAWAPLKGKWLELEDSQYTYKLCLFERAIQEEKDEYMETNLGHWREWSGDENNRYKEQRYDNGQGCWNGPERSTTVIVECGEETELVEATEPAKCEYRFVVRSPAACPDPATITNVHEEL